MKKILSIALVAIVALTAQSASIPWSSAALSFGDVSLKNSTAVVGYLIALDGLSLDAEYALTEGFTASVIGTLVDTDNNGASRASKVAGTADITDYTNGDAFVMLVTYTDGEDTYYNLSSSVFTLSGLDPNDPSVAPSQWDDFAFNNATSSEKGTLKSGGGWTAVPEPASAMLALAGVAMLIRRRK